ncbi:MAG: hypothetical protein EOP49_17555 [Sphingobacteriales bacterium]|nr:MAG: hypothetical protein EOP49_17555 [Sphingobacteriales bacterium]
MKCEDMRALKDLKQPEVLECKICVQHGGEWVHLRTCQTCGITLCCDDSPEQHATRHFERTGHPVIISAEPEEQWIWCYKHDLFKPYR